MRFRRFAGHEFRNLAAFGAKKLENRILVFEILSLHTTQQSFIFSASKSCMWTIFIAV